jgi:hypothetical protein
MGSLLKNRAALPQFELQLNWSLVPAFQRGDERMVLLLGGRSQGAKGVSRTWIDKVGILLGGENLRGADTLPPPPLPPPPHELAGVGPATSRRLVAN